MYQVIEKLSPDYNDKLQRYFGCADDSHGSNGCWDEAGDSQINLQIVKMTGGTPEVRSDKSLILLTFGPMDQWTNGPMDQWTN